jgi:hypothetical protein
MNAKFRIKNAAHSEAIQKRLFELGYRWDISGTNVVYVDKRYLYCTPSEITHGDTEGHFVAHKYKEFILDDLYHDFRDEETPEDAQIKVLTDRLETFEQKYNALVDILNRHFPYYLRGYKV